MADKPSYEELQAQLKSTREELEKSKQDLEKSIAQNEALGGQLASAKNEVATLRKGLSLSRGKDMSPEIRAMVEEKMAAGLSEQAAIECAFRQVTHNENLAKAKKAAATQKTAKA